jgi:DNA-binding CsgD family transcriptional regulator
MRDYAKRYGRQSYMVCGIQIEAQPDLMAWLSLYRGDAEAQFSEAERALYSGLMAHLHEALQINRRLHLCQTFDSGVQEVLAIADPWGYLHTPPDDVRRLLSAEWPKSASGRLPATLVDVLNAEQEATYRGRAIRVRSRRVGGMLFLRMRRCSLLDGLSAREQQVANTISRGLSAKESGKALGLAPATIRVHLKRIYDKLSVHSQAELAYLIGQSRPDAASPPTAPVVREAG